MLAIAVNTIYRVAVHRDESDLDLNFCLYFSNGTLPLFSKSVWTFIGWYNFDNLRPKRSVKDPQKRQKFKIEYIGKKTNISS